MTIQLCVLLWAKPGATQALIEYEDTVLALLPEHQGSVVQRARAQSGDAAPTEIQLIEFADQAGYDGFMADDRRTALAAQRDAAIARTELYRVRIVPAQS